MVDSPQASFSTAGAREAGLYQCRNRSPWAAGTQLKFSAIYTLPWQIRDQRDVSERRQHPTHGQLRRVECRHPAIARPRSRRVPRRGGLHRDRPGGSRWPNNQVYREGRNTQLNIRLSRVFHVRGLRLEPQLDVFNLTNSNQVLGMTTRYGAAWQNATSILAPRVFKLGAQVSF